MNEVDFFLFLAEGEQNSMFIISVSMKFINFRKRVLKPCVLWTTEGHSSILLKTFFPSFGAPAHPPHLRVFSLYTPPLSQLPICPSQSSLQPSIFLWHTPQFTAMPLTHWVRPGIEPTSSWILVGFISDEPQQELLKSYILIWTWHFFHTQFQMMVT